MAARTRSARTSATAGKSSDSFSVARMSGSASSIQRARERGERLGGQAHQRRRDRLGRPRQLQLDRLPARGVERLPAARRDLGGAVLPVGVAHEAHPQPGAIACRQLASEQDRAEQARVGRVAAEDAGRAEGHVARRVALARRRAERGLQAGHPAVGRGQPGRAPAVGADRPAHQARADRGGRAARRAAPAARGVPRVADRAPDRDPPRRPQTQVVHLRQADDDRPGVAQAAIRPRLAGRRQLVLGSHTRAAPRQREHVLHRDRHAVQRSGRRLREHPLRLLTEQLRSRVQLPVAGGEASERGFEQLLRVERPACGPQRPGRPGRGPAGGSRRRSRRVEPELGVLGRPGRPPSARAARVRRRRRPSASAAGPPR